MRNLPDHNYKIEIFARDEELNNIGLLMDFVDLKEKAWTGLPNISVTAI